jgi:hypothetical protein
MIAPIVLNLDDVAYCDLLTLVTKGALRPGRITPRGAVVYELTADGVAAVEAWAAAADGGLDLRELGEACDAGECEHADNHESERELRLEAEQTIVSAHCALLDLINALGKARISDAAKAALAKLGEELAT